MKYFFISLCLWCSLYTQQFTFHQQNTSQQGTLWIISYPQLQSGSFVCRLLFNDNDEIANSRQWLRFYNRNFTYVYETKNRNILRGKYTLEVLQKHLRGKQQTIPRKYHFYIGTPQEIATQHYTHNKLFLSFCEYLNKSPRAFKKARKSLCSEDKNQQHVAQWYQQQQQKIREWEQQVTAFFYPQAITSYHFHIQQNTRKALEIFRQITDMHMKWILANKNLEGLSSEFADILTQDLPDLEKKMATLHTQIRHQVLTSPKNAMGDLLEQIAQYTSSTNVEVWKVQLQQQQLLFENRQQQKMADLLREIHQSLNAEHATTEEANIREIQQLAIQAQQTLKNISSSKKTYDKNYFSSILKKLAKSPRLSDQQIKTLEKKLHVMKEHECYRSFTGLVYWLKVYKLYKAQPETQQLYVEKSKLNIRLLVTQLQDCLTE